MEVQYGFTLQHPSAPPRQVFFRVNTERSSDEQLANPLVTSLPAWTKLEYQRCPGCALSTQTHSHCPIAVDVYSTFGALAPLISHERAEVEVVTPQRVYVKRTTVEEGVRSLMGLLMSSSACPAFTLLRPLARQHLPFATKQENALRVAAFYLLRQYFAAQEGGKPDWSLERLMYDFRQLKVVNHAFWQRMVGHLPNDAHARALLSYFTFASSLAGAIEQELDQVHDQYFRDGQAIQRGF